MGLFDAFKKKKPQGPFGGATEVKAQVYTGSEDLDVVGESYHQDELWFLVGGVTQDRVRQEIAAILLPDPANQYDPNAIGVHINGLLVGHLGRDDAARLTPGVKALMAKHPGEYVAMEGVIAGGGMRGDGLGRLGVFLKYDPVDFGLEPARGRSMDEPVQFSLRTGYSEAMATDAEDDSYDLSWMSTLSPDGPKALRQLRELAATNQEPISRHFIFSELERLLYGYRDDLPGALAEFDEWTEKHHQELADGLRQVLIDKFTALPLLETYKQACIRHSKAKNYEAVALWAERGIAVYGDDAFKDEWVADLEKRAAQAHTRLEKASAPKVAKTATVVGAAQKAADGSMVEVLTCQTCGKDFERVRTRGRKPSECPECRGTSQTP